MFDDYDWNVKEGRGTAADLTLFTLSTCGFCASARKYLEERGFAYRYLHLDKLPAERKSDLKEEFRAQFGKRPSFPTLIIEDKRILTGFIKKHWDEEIYPEKDS